MFDFIYDFNIENSIIETEATKQINTENFVDYFIGQPFNFKINPEFETIHNFNLNDLSLYKPVNKELNSTNNKNNLFSTNIQKKEAEKNLEKKKIQSLMINFLMIIY